MCSLSLSPFFLCVGLCGKVASIKHHDGRDIMLTKQIHSPKAVIHKGPFWSSDLKMNAGHGGMSFFDSQCPYIGRLHDYLRGTGVAALVEPTVGIDAHCLALKSRDVDVPLDFLQEGEKPRDTHSWQQQSHNTHTGRATLGPCQYFPRVSRHLNDL